MSEPITFKLNNKFKVSNFMELVNVDFLYSYDIGKRRFLLLNNDLFGEINPDTVKEQIKNNRVIVIEIPNNIMKAYNIEEEQLIEGFLNMGDL